MAFMSFSCMWLTWCPCHTHGLCYYALAKNLTRGCICLASIFYGLLALTIARIIILAGSDIYCKFPYYINALAGVKLPDVNFILMYSQNNLYLC